MTMLDKDTCTIKSRIPEESDRLEAAFSDPGQEMLSVITQELRTALTPIRAVLDLLHCGKLHSTSEQGRHLLEIATGNTERLMRLLYAIEDEPAPQMAVTSRESFELLQLKVNLHSAWEHKAFKLVYQPIFSLEVDQIVGFEALLRWQHPTQGSIAPAVFIPLAEAMGLIHPLGIWVLEQACHQLHHFQQQLSAHPPLMMSVNLSPLQLLQPALVSQVQAVLQKTGVPASSLKLEITESALIENQEMAITTLSALQSLGIQLYIDDFGTGYSSLSRLQDLPIDGLKIDRSFVSGQKWNICQAIMLLASELGVEVIVEGVETADELASLQSIGCQQIQGYYYSRPVDALTAGDLISASLSG